LGCLLEGLYARGLSRRALRGGEVPTAVPLPPVGLRRADGRESCVRPSRASAPATADRNRCERLRGRAQRFHQPGRPVVLEPSMTRRRLELLLAAAVVAMVGTACSSKSPSMLNTAGDEASRIAGVWWILFFMATAVYVIVAGFVIYGSLRGRRKRDPA